MSADLLREAAALMRSRAEAVDEPGDEWWSVDSFAEVTNYDDAEHFVAFGRPVVALAVADWLDATAAEHESDSGNPRVDDFFAAFDTAPDIAALAVARAYLTPTTPATSPSD
jgi:hypothetical protein